MTCEHALVAEADMSDAAQSVERTCSTEALVVAPGVVGMVLFVLTEAMFFAGLISALFVIHAAHADAWPPEGQPRLPVLVTAFNTALLLASGWTVRRALTDIRRGEVLGSHAWLRATAILGGFFLVVQGSEWARLVSHGLTMTSSLYGGVFYLLVGAHALHVLGALIALLVVLSRSKRGRYSADEHLGVQLCQMYWIFVVVVWPVIYGCVYF